MKLSHIWIDADACPKQVKDILFRAAQRVNVPLILVANQPLYTPPSPLISSVIVPGGYDVADAHIAENLSPGDLVITADIPLAALVVEKGAFALDPRGEMYTEDNIGERLSMRGLYGRPQEWRRGNRRPPALWEKGTYKNSPTASTGF